MTPAGARPAVLLDVDGTLIDSNYLHVHAWFRAFDEANVEVEAWRMRMSRVPWNFGGAPVSIRLRSPAHHA